METRVTFREWTFEVDVQRTAEVYRGVSKASAETCGCHACLNFAAQRDSSYGSELKSLLEDLGIDHRKEDEVSHLYRNANGLHNYNGCFHFKGRIAEGRDCRVPAGTDGYTVSGVLLNEHINIGFFKPPYRVYDRFAAEEHGGLIQVDFSILLPWVLKDVEEST
jgi:hypothetical protein